MPIPYGMRFDMLMDPNERKGLPLLTNDEVYRMYRVLAERLIKLTDENTVLRNELVRRGILHPSRDEILDQS